MTGLLRSLAIVGTVFTLVLAAGGAGAQTIFDTKHNLSASGTGAVRALSETRVCVFCHTPHDAVSQTPLWNPDIEGEGQTYALFTSEYLKVPSQPLQPSRLCLSCHDGSLALGDVRKPSTRIAMTRATLAGPASIGWDLSNDHPISFDYEAVATDEFASAQEVRGAAGITLYAGARGYSVECPTCHDPHKDRYLSPDKEVKLTGKFLAADNRWSQLCLVCHIIPGWKNSKHATSTAEVPAVFPVAPREWPTWRTVSEWGCLSCHTTHGGAGPSLLYRGLVDTCTPCHGVGAAIPTALRSPEGAGAARSGLRGGFGHESGDAAQRRGTHGCLSNMFTNSIRVVLSNAKMNAHININSKSANSADSESDQGNNNDFNCISHRQDLSRMHQAGGSLLNSAKGRLTMFCRKEWSCWPLVHRVDRSEPDRLTEWEGLLQQEV